MGTIRMATHSTFGANTPPREQRIRHDMSAHTLLIEGFPDREYWLEQLVKPTFLADITQHEFSANIGIAKCNPLDDFSRKEGIKRAKETLVPVTLHPTSIVIYAESMYLTCRTIDGLSFGVNLIGGRGNLHYYDNPNAIYNSLYPRTDTNNG